MLGSSIKKLIIVTGEKENTYAELLSSLIAIKDDKNDEQSSEVGIVGVPDGSVETVVWDERIYNDSKPQISSSTKILFMGKLKSAGATISNVKFNNSMEKYGVFVGYLSNKAVIYIDKGVLGSKDKYEQFFEDYKKTVDKFDDKVADSKAIKKAKYTDGINQAFGKGINAVGGFFGNVFGGDNKIEGTDFFDFGAKIEANSLVPDQMYRYAVLSFYLEELADFMEK